MHLTPLEPWIARKAGLERLTRAELEAYQLARLQETLRLVRERSPFYRQHLAGCPTTLGSLADLSALPFTTADDIRQNPLRFLCVSQSEVERVVTLPTSGTTGTPKRIFFSRADQELTLDFFHIGMSTFTRPGDRVLILPVARQAAWVTCWPMRWSGWARTASGMARCRTCRTTALLTRSERWWACPQVRARPRWRQRPHRTHQSVLHRWTITASIVSTGASLALPLQSLRRQWGWAAALTVDGAASARGRSVRRDCRPADSPSPMGSRAGHSRLTRHAMPLLRYRTGDISRFLPACPCGTCLKTAHVRAGAGIIRSARVRLSIAELDEVIFRFDKVLDFTAMSGRMAGRA